MALDSVRTDLAPSSSQTRKRVVVVLALWCLVSVIVPLLGVFKNDPFQLLPSVAFFLPSILFVIWYSMSPGFQAFVLSLDLRMVTYFQMIRLPGALLFVYSYFQKHLPGAWLIPAIVADLVIGGTAPIAVSMVSKTPFPKRVFIGWHILGILTFIMDLVLRILTSPVAWGILAGEITSRAFNVLPYSFFPTFVAPLIVIFHIAAVFQALNFEKPSQRST